MDPVTLARKMWETAEVCSTPPNSRDWWITVATTALREIDDEAKSLVQQELGGEVISTEVSAAETFPADQHCIDANCAECGESATTSTSAQTIAHDGIGPRAAAHRTICSQRAQFDRAVPLDRRFRPSTWGYSAEDMLRDYPHVEPRDVLERFLSHHIAKGDTSRNWLEKFWSFCLNGERMAKERAADKTSTDSMGQPLDPAERARRLRVARDHEAQQNQYIDQQIAEQESNQ